MDIATIKGTPIFAIDVWEHAYYLDYLNKKKRLFIYNLECCQLDKQAKDIMTLLQIQVNLLFGQEETGFIK